MVSVGVGSRVPQMRVLTPTHHPTIAANGQVTLLTGTMATLMAYGPDTDECLSR